MKDAVASIFNPSGHAARRQYLLQQVSTIPCDIVCIQEARSKAGRWPNGGWLSWRSGHQKGQFGCEVWVRPSIVRPPLTLDSWRIVAACPRYIIVTCVDERLPLTICSAHAAHAERPDREAHSFWDSLSRDLLRASPRKGLVVGIDANGDFFTEDDDAALVGTILAAGEPARNDNRLFELCLHLGLTAPATHRDIQRGPGWSWQHPSGVQKRIDHILLREGPWSPVSASQALDLDLCTAHKDHVPLRVVARLSCPAVVGRRIHTRRAQPAEAARDGDLVWQAVRETAAEGFGCRDRVGDFLHCHSEWQRALPARAPVQPRQPYLQKRTIDVLTALRDWRASTRQIRAQLSLCRLNCAFQSWRHGACSVGAAAEARDSLRLLSAMEGQALVLQRRAHNLARRDKQAHFLSLTSGAVNAWHDWGRPTEAINHLRWASRRAAERRSVHAAGGYDIDAQLEEQFRSQEAGRLMSSKHIADAIRRWRQQEAPMCPSAAPTLLQAEDACRRQRTGKAPGPDGILNELWHHFPAYAGAWLWEVCTVSALTGREPAHFKAALVCALYKKGPASLPQNYRSIALLNGMAKLWHGHLRRSIGGSVLQGYDPLQLGGKPGIPVAFAVSVFRAAWELSVQQNRCHAVLFIDIQAAYYEASRDLVFRGGPLDSPDEGLPCEHLLALAQDLLTTGALERLGVPHSERSLLQDCVACSHWRLVTSQRWFLASRGSRPGDGLADVLFGALFAVGLNHIKRACSACGIQHVAAGSLVGSEDTILPLGWADDLAILSDYDCPRQLQTDFPKLAGIAISTLQALKFRVNLGAGKTEAMLDIRGAEAKQVRREMLLSEPPPVYWA